MYFCLLVMIIPEGIANTNSRLEWTHLAMNFNWELQSGGHGSPNSDVHLFGFLIKTHLAKWRSLFSVTVAGFWGKVDGNKQHLAIKRIAI